MKANISQLYRKNKKGELKPTWRYWLGILLGSVEGVDDSSEDSTKEFTRLEK